MYSWLPKDTSSNGLSVHYLFPEMEWVANINFIPVATIVLKISRIMVSSLQDII